MIPLGTMFNPQAQGSNIMIETDRFNTGAAEAMVEFQGGGVDSNFGLSVQTGVYIEEVKMKISSVAQPAGSRDYPSNIGVDFGGDRALEWAWQGPGYGPLGRQTMFVNNKPVMNASVPMGGGYNDTTAFRLPKSAIVKSAVVNISAGMKIGTPGKILVLNGANPYYGWATDPVNRLKTFTNDFNTVDRIDANSKTPTWDEIKDYSAILTATEGYYYGMGYRNSDEMGNLLADYVDAGGSLVCMFMTFYDGTPYRLGGRFYSDGYYAIQPSYSYTSSSAGIGEIVIPNHPVMANVNSISFSYYGYTYRTYNPTLTTGAETISKWGDGYIMAAQKNVGGVDRVDLNMVPFSQYVSYPYLAYYGDGDDLMRNALLYGGRKAIDARVDVLNDKTEEFNRTGYMGNFTLPDFSAALNSYLATAPVSYEDRYGNQFVDVPINVSSPTGGRLSFNSLAITYDYSTSVDENPLNGNLTLAVSDLQSTILGEQNLTIPIFVSSSSSGKLRMFDLYVRVTPPQHKPRIDSFYPALETSVPEASTLDFRVNATDIYRNPMTFTWFDDEERLPGTTSARLSIEYGFEDAGMHTVTCRVANGISEKTFIDLVWQVTVTDVNRPPEIHTFSPAGDVTMEENSTQLFSVAASDPDPGEVLSHSWFLDNKPVAGAEGDNYTYAPGFFDGGLHTIKAVVSDGGGATDFKVWQATVTDINMVPSIQAWSPKQDPRIAETEAVEFSITALDLDKDDRVTITWYIDDAAVFIGNPFNYQSDYKSAGTHVVKAVASDGVGQEAHTWTLTVDNVNRQPFPAIDSPIDQSEYMEGQAIKFSARYTTDPDNETLSFSWKEGGINVSDQMEFERAFPPGLHTLTLEVRDRSGGGASTTVRFRVRFVEISTAIGLDRFEVQAGNRVSIILTMSNIGDANGTDVPVEVSVDGSVIGTTTIKDLRPGGVDKLVYMWKATKGPHTIKAKVGEDTWTKQITVAAAPAPPPSAGIGDYAWTIIIVVIVVALLAFGMMALKKK
jgi:hypothetical protein